MDPFAKRNNLRSFIRFFTDDSTGYVVGNTGTILKTTNSGTSWTTLPQVTGQPLTTDDAGTTWTTLSAGNNHNLNSIFFTDTSTGYLAGDTGTILKTLNGGISWSSQVSGTTAGFKSIFFTGRDTGYVMGNNGTILKTTNGGGNPFGVSELPSTAGRLKIHPNPSSGRFTIEDPENRADGFLTIMDPIGQTIMEYLVSGPSNQADLSKLPSGCYFVRLTSERMVKVARIIKH